MSTKYDPELFYFTNYKTYYVENNRNHRSMAAYASILSFMALNVGHKPTSCSETHNPSIIKNYYTDLAR